MSDDKSPPTGGNYRVGRGKPPPEHQFKPGHKGKGGRPKGSKAKTSIEKMLAKQYTVREGDKSVRLTLQEMIERKAAKKAMDGNERLMMHFLNLVRELEKEQAARGPTAQEILAQKAEEDEKRRLAEKLSASIVGWLDFQAAMMQENILKPGGGLSSFELQDWVHEAIKDCPEYHAKRKRRGGPATLKHLSSGLD